MIKISKLADYAVVILATFARNDQNLLTASVIAGQTHLPEPTVAKVLKILTKAEILNSIRGANGGYQLHKNPADLSVADIVQAIEGPIALTACVEGAQDSCCYEGACPVKGRWDGVNLAMKQALESVKLSDMIATDNMILTQNNTRNIKGDHEHF